MVLLNMEAGRGEGLPGLQNSGGGVLPHYEFYVAELST